MHHAPFAADTLGRVAGIATGENRSTQASTGELAASWTDAVTIRVWNICLYIGVP